MLTRKYTSQLHPIHILIFTYGLSRLSIFFVAPSQTDASIHYLVRTLALYQ
ncbi:hypothetical protein SXCC_01909 [Gluconacetobacter sp. SXCC-1]|nr:hypothetical protein SXCC_01909 [Gluconacetobacter sp. SXCC-1]